MVIKHKRRPGLQPSQMEHETRRKLGFVDGVFPLRCRAGMILTTKNPRKQSFATGTGTGITIFRTVRSAGITNIRNKKPQISGTQREREPSFPLAAVLARILQETNNF
tara:strand:- start:97 stop:420 length:324 start_codon:yes stop_codon:yes gene_type:complete